ncbi:MAG: hypothetical protein AB8H86_27830 [Polyangiales bacterium]
MSHSIKRLGLLGFTLSIAAFPALLGCSAQDAGALDADADADTGGLGDASVDAGASVDGGVVPAVPGEDDGLWLGSARGNETNNDMSFDADTCFDGLDNDDEGDGADCNDAQCQVFPSCCANEAECVADSTLLIDNNYEGCSNAVCGEDFVIFGGPFEPVLDDGSLALQGDSFYDTGLYGGETMNLRHQRIDIAVEFRLGDCADCRETAAVALTSQTVPTENTFIQPLVGLRALAGTDGTDAEVQFIVHDRVVRTFPATEGAWTLSIRPDGQVEVQHGTETFRREFVPVAGAHLALYGHSTNPGVDVVGARIESLKVERYVVDRVDAWSPARSLELPGGRVSVARLGGVDYLAINDALSENVHGVRFHLASDGSVLNWLFESDWEARDYSIAQLGESIYVCAINADGHLIRGLVNLEDSEVGAPEFVLNPNDLEWDDMANPVVIQTSTSTIVVAEVDGALDAAFLRGVTWVALGSLPPLTRGAREPSLVAHDNVYWLHYTAQSGTRERVRAMVSDQMFYWRELGDALVGSGEPGSVDRFSVASPAVVSDGDSLRMYMSADDHVLRRLAVVERFSPMGRAR